MVVVDVLILVPYVHIAGMCNNDAHCHSLQQCADTEQQDVTAAPHRITLRLPSTMPDLSVVAGDLAGEELGRVESDEAQKMAPPDGDASKHVVDGHSTQQAPAPTESSPPSQQQQQPPATGIKLVLKL